VTVLIDQLLIPQRLLSRAMGDLKRIADAGASLAALAGEVWRELAPLADTVERAVDMLDSMRDELASLRAGFEPLSNDLDSLRGAFAATTDELIRLRESIAPELGGVHLAAEGLHEQVRGQRESINRIDVTLSDLAGDLNSRLEALIGTLRPLVGNLDEVRETVEPLQAATERVGRIAERLPGPGRKRKSD
jgi:ABC-type transporter Mla subunit MlaD